ncbi:MAG TPA: hypothetical protein VG429_01180 [Casimicrobiaceae bacterium]|jgi:hypothetical protein|nr:hypothetical protein [Casimicrobiaceae bacterium]
MRQFIEIAAFWAIVLVAICVLSRYPESWPGRILFARLGPLPQRREPRSRYLLRWSLYCASWFVQAVVVLAIGWAVLRLNSSLYASLFFQVFWLAVVPLLAAVALLASLVTLTAAVWRRHLGAERHQRSAAQVISA